LKGAAVIANQSFCTFPAILFHFEKHLITDQCKQLTQQAVPLLQAVSISDISNVQQIFEARKFL
jgi:hypothetical protein